MSARQGLVIVGAGGLGLEAYWVAAAMNAAGTGAWEIRGFADDQPDRVGGEHCGIPVIASSEDIAARLGSQVRVHFAIGDNHQRARLAEICADQGLKAATLVHPRAELAPGTRIGEGSYVAPFAVLAPRAAIGRHAIVNLHAVVGHEVTVGDFAQLAPGAVLTGGCALGAGVFVGTNASLFPGRRMGDFSVVGGNSFVTTDVLPEETVMGIPAKPVFRRR